MIIKEFSIKNFRSLKDIKFDNFGDTTIFYGDNNVGKSNVLYALYIIFKRKKQFDVQMSKPTENEINFYEGLIENFKFDFHNDTKSDIVFDVSITINKSELLLTDDTKKKIFDKSIPDEIIVNFKGIIKRFPKMLDSSELKMEIISVNNSNIYENNIEINYFPDLDQLKKKKEQYRNEFESFVNQFNDCVGLISSSRDMLITKYYKEENKVINKEDNKEINSINFKSVFNEMYLNVESYSIFEKINDIFNKEPFRFGEISFANIDGKLEIMIKENGKRLPIKHLGSGVLQVLFILTLIVQNKSKIYCIEELEQNISPTNQNLALRKLQEFLNKNNTTLLHQLILSTHSRVFKNAKLYDELYYLEIHNNETIIKEKKEKGEKLSREFTNFADGRPKKKSKDKKRFENYAY